MKCNYEVSGGGTLDLSLGEIDDLTPEGVERWLYDGAGIEIIEQGNYVVRLRPCYSAPELQRAIEEELKNREEDSSAE
jgi:hypothetical protein